jgi:hypothetical protein
MGRRRANPTGGSEVAMGSLPASGVIGEAGNRRWRRWRFDGGSQQSLGWTQSTTSSATGSGELRLNSGDVVTNVV